jgi:hypothetical protein
LATVGRPRLDTVLEGNLEAAKQGGDHPPGSDRRDELEAVDALAELAFAV